MISHSSRRPRRNPLFDHLYDAVNNSDLNQLEAYMLALLVFALGLGLLGGTFLLGKLQALASPHHRYDSKPIVFVVGRRYVQQNGWALPLRPMAPAGTDQFPLNPNLYPQTSFSPASTFAFAPAASTFAPVDRMVVTKMFGRPRSQSTSSPFGLSRAGQAEAANGAWY